jgi:lipopolysaccharide exporter
VLNSAALTVGQLLIRAISTLSAFVVARALGPSGVGEIALALTLAVFFAGLGDAGITLVSYREIVLEPKKLSQIVTDTTFLQLWLSLLLAGALALIALVVPMPTGSARLLLLFTPFLLAQALSVDYALRALERMVTVAVIAVLIQLITSVGTVTLVLATHDPIWVAIMLWFAQLVGDAVIWWQVRLSDRFEFKRPRPSATTRLLKAGLPLLVTTVLLNYWGVVSTVSLAWLRSSHVLGIYSAPFSLVFTAWAMSEVASGGAYPELVRRARDDHEGFAALLDTLVRLTTRITLAIAAFVVVAAEPLVRLIYGGRFAASGPILQILAPIIPLGWFCSFVGYALLAGGEQRAFAQGLFTGAVFATVAYPIGAMLLGATGTAIVSTTTVIIFATALAWHASRRLGVNPTAAALREWRYGLLPLAALIVVAAVVSFEPILTLLAAWVLVVSAVEVANGLATARQLIAVRRLAPTHRA